MLKRLEGKRPKYYEAILQLRDFEKEVEQFVKKEIDREDARVAKVKSVRGGLDYYLADKNFTKNLGKKLVDKFGGEYIVTGSLWGKKDGRDVYRTTVLFRCFAFKKGDLVEYEGEQYYIKILTQKEIVLQHQKSGEKVRVRYKEMKRIRKVA
ncbi:MAG: NMD3-related protein [Candidatus Woesearchaeota archaeon]